MVDYIRQSAIVSECGKYRRTLVRRWHKRASSVLFVMLNPSTADALEDDHTIKRCVRFAYNWGYDGLIVENLWDFRSTDWSVLNVQVERERHDFPLMDGEVTHPPICSELNDRALRRSARDAHLIVAAWGAHALRG